MTDRCGPFLSHQLKVRKPRQAERLDQLVVAAMGDGDRHGFATDRRGFEAPGAPTGVDVETFDRCRAHNWREVGRHVTEAAPLPENVDITKKREQIEQVTADTFGE